MIKLKIDLKLNGPGSVRVLYFIWLKSLVRFDSSKGHLINIIIQSPAAFWPKGNIVTKSSFSAPNSLFSINPLSYLVLYFRTVSTPHAHNFLQLTLSSLISHFHFHFHFLTSIWDLGSTVPSLSLTHFINSILLQLIQSQSIQPESWRTSSLLRLCMDMLKVAVARMRLRRSQFDLSS